MSCARARQLLDAWIDGELDPATREEIGAHFPSCPACGEALEERQRLRSMLRESMPREAMPAAAAAAVRRAVAREGETRTLRRRGPTWLQALGLSAATAAAAVFATAAWLGVATTDPITEDALGRHVAALAAAGGNSERLVQVATSDRHAVKPWFQGKVDFAPPVKDLSTEGFTLLGGRLDRVGGHDAGVVIYRIRNHSVELYVWRESAERPQRVEQRRGFSVATWATGGLQYAAVSDVDHADLERFARAFLPL